jgi:hypothetical protein
VIIPVMRFLEMIVLLGVVLVGGCANQAERQGSPPSASTQGTSPSASTRDTEAALPSTEPEPPIAAAQQQFDAAIAGPSEPPPAEEPALKLDEKPKKFRDAVALLGFPDTWCKGAAKLARLGDRDALVPLLEAYDSRPEGSRVCLLDAMEALGALTTAHEMARGPGEQTMSMGLRLMGLVFDDSHVAVLEPIAARPDVSDRIRAQALHALATQRQTPEWVAAMIRLLAAAPPATRAQAVRSLAPRNTGDVREALRARAAVETDPNVKKLLEGLVE